MPHEIKAKSASADSKVYCHWQSLGVCRIKHVFTERSGDYVSDAGSLGVLIWDQMVASKQETKYEFDLMEWLKNSHFLAVLCHVIVF